MAFTTSPNMNLPIPGVGTESGPQYAIDINNALMTIDQHNHSSGSGVQINPSGININTNLTFNNNFGTNLAGLTLTAQGSTPADQTVYVSGVDLYYTDGVGNNVRITQSGGVAGSPGSISNLSSPASAAYVSASSTFVWQSNTSIAANMDLGSILMRNLSPNSTFALTLSPPAALASNYTLTLPTIPGAATLLGMDTSGNFTTNASSIVATSNIANNAVTRPKLASVGQQISSSCGFFTASGIVTNTSVTNLSVTITTSGRPVMIGLQDDGSGSLQGITMSVGATNDTNEVSMKLFRGATNINNYIYQVLNSTGWSNPGNFYYLDTPSAGTYTYSITVTTFHSTASLAISNLVLVAYEL